MKEKVKTKIKKMYFKNNKKCSSSIFHYLG